MIKINKIFKKITNKIYHKKKNKMNINRIMITKKTINKYLKKKKNKMNINRIMMNKKVINKYLKKDNKTKIKQNHNKNLKNIRII